MRKKLLLLFAVAIMALGLAGPASAHWQARQVLANNQWWAIHYDLNSFTRGVTYFASSGGYYAVPYAIQIYHPTFGALCGTPKTVTNIGAPYNTIYCATPFASLGYRARIWTPLNFNAQGGYSSIGYYVNDNLY